MPRATKGCARKRSRKRLLNKTEGYWGGRGNLYRKAMETKIPFDAVILDLTVPGGLGAKETIKKLLEIDPEAKAILSSGYSNDPIIDRFRQFGFKDVIAKPYTVGELSQRVANVIEASV